MEVITSSVPVMLVFTQLLSYLILDWAGHHDCNQNSMYFCCCLCAPSAIFPCNVQLHFCPRLLRAGFILTVGTFAK